MYPNAKMRQNNRQKSFWYLVALVCICFVIYKVVKNESPALEPRENGGLDLPSSKHGQFFSGDENTVTVPLAQIMSGKPFILPQNDPRIIKYILSNDYIRPPSNSPYNLKDTSADPSRGQAQFIRRILKNMTDGFFVECGALDGETRSNTLFMEMELGWKGLLVEGDPSNFALMEAKNRKAWIANTCLSVKPYPHTVEFLQRFNQGKVLGTEEENSHAGKTVTVQCMPLFSLLTAINVTTVDYFSLDVEGNELQVLKTIPFDKVYIRTLSVEYIHTIEGKNDLLAFMKEKGYQKVGEVHYPNNLANDYMFVHKDAEVDV